MDVGLGGVDSVSAAENIPGEVRMTMRKMAKKDVTTKLKVGRGKGNLKKEKNLQAFEYGQLGGY